MNRAIVCIIFAVMLVGTVWALTADRGRVIALAEKTYGAPASRRVEQWFSLIDQLKSASEMNKIRRVNSFYNGFRFLNDNVVWGQEDYWATPLEFTSIGAGDCEDYTIAKYFTLRELGVADDKLRLIYVKALRLNEFHMVLGYYPDDSAVPLILDNLVPDVRPASTRNDLAPVYSFNGSELWMMKQLGQGKPAGKASRLSKWNSLRSRFNSLQLQQPRIRVE